MQHLLRRLTLDFRDVLGKGFAFDSAHVAGTVKNGVLSIPKASVLGSSATVMVGGSISLVRGDARPRRHHSPRHQRGRAGACALDHQPRRRHRHLPHAVGSQDQLSNMFRMEYEIKGPFDDPSSRRPREQNSARKSSPPRPASASARFSTRTHPLQCADTTSLSF